MSDQQPNSDLLNPYCEKCHGSKELIHVITHECLEGDALRCVIKAVPDNAPLDPDDYVRVNDLLLYLQGSINVPSSSVSTAAVAAPTSSSTALVAGTSTASNAATSTPTSTVLTTSSTATSSSTVSTTTAGSTSAAPSLLTITATADDLSTTITTTVTLAVPTTFVPSSTYSIGYVGAASSTLSYPLVSSIPTLLPTLSTPITVIQPSTSTVFESGVSVSCTTFLKTMVFSLPSGSSMTASMTDFPSSFFTPPNSQTVYPPPGGWPFQQSSATTNSSSATPTATPSIDAGRTNRILQPAANAAAAAAAAANGRVKDSPMAMSKLLAGLARRRPGYGDKDSSYDSEFWTTDEDEPAFKRPVTDLTDRSYDSEFWTSDEDEPALKVPVTDRSAEDVTDDEADSTIADRPAFNIASFFNDHPAVDLRVPQLAQREEKLKTRSDVKIDDAIARIILKADETLNPNSALLLKLRPHLRMSPRELPESTGFATATRVVTETYQAPETATVAPTAQPTHTGSNPFPVAGPYDKAILGLLIVTFLASVAGFATMFIKKRKASSISRV